MDEDIVHETGNAVQAFEDLAHPSLEEFRGAGNPKGQLIKVIASKGRSEGCEETGFW